MNLLFKILKKLFWFIFYVVIAIVAIFFVYKGILKFEFNDSIKYKDIEYSSIKKDMCLSFDNNSYELDNCKGNKSSLPFDSSNNCSLNYSKGYNSILFDCGIKNKYLVKFNVLNFNKIVLEYKKKQYTFLNTNTFSTMDGLQKITFSFVDEKNIRFNKYLDNNLVDEEVCPYSYGIDDSLGLECQRFYGYSSFKIDSYNDKTVNIVIRGVKTKFKLEN